MDITPVTKLRTQIRDLQHSRKALSLAVNEPNPYPTAPPYPAAYVEITRNHLVITTTNLTGVPSNIDINLANPMYETIGQLADALSRTNGIRCTQDENVNLDHPCLDLKSFGPVNIIGTGIELCHHIFSDRELESILKQALNRHNPSLSLHTAPEHELDLILELAESIVYRKWAADGAKRAGQEKSVDQLIKLAADHEATYDRVRTRISKTLSTPRESNPNLTREGDVILGTMTRSSPRTAYQSPASAALPPDPGVLLEPVPGDCADTDIKIRWQKTRIYSFYSYELWMDTQPEVTRGREDVAQANSFVATFGTSTNRDTTSTLVFRSLGTNRNTFALATLSIDIGQSISQFIKGELEPETEYFFRLYVTNMNGELASSNVVSYRTLALRAKFRTTSPFSSVSVEAGDVVTVHLDTDWGVLTGDHVVTMGGKSVSVTPLGDHSFTFVVPTFVQKGSKDMTITSPSGLYHVLKNAIKVV